MNSQTDCMDKCEELKKDCQYVVVDKYNSNCGLVKENGDATFYQLDSPG